MKKIILFIATVLITKIAISQTVSVDSAKFYEGKTITVCGKVVDSYISKGEKKNVKLNFDKPYPETPFIVMIFEADLPNFKYNPTEFLINKNVCATGVVKIYKDKPEIVISSPEQLIIK